MSYLISTLLFTGFVTAQITTSFPYVKAYLGTDKIGFYGSVVGAADGHTTLAIQFDNGTDFKALKLPAFNQTLTIAPTMFEAKTVLRPYTPANATDTPNYMLRCEVPTATAEADAKCTVSMGGILARARECPTASATRAVAPRTTVRNQTVTYSGRETYSAGVETIVRTYVVGGNTMPPPSWCSDTKLTPENGTTLTMTLKKDEIAMYQVVITAGMEKLNATQGASVSSSIASVTAAPPPGTKPASGVLAPASGSASKPASTGAAAPMMTMAPMLAGLGAAIAAFV